MDHFLRSEANVKLIKHYLEFNKMQRILSKNQSKSYQQAYELAIKYLLGRSRQLHMKQQKYASLPPKFNSEQK